MPYMKNIKIQDWWNLFTGIIRGTLYNAMIILKTHIYKILLFGIFNIY